MLALEDESQEVVVVLALPLLRANGGNCLKPDELAERPVRYRQRWRDVRNTFGDDTRQIAVMQPELTLRFAHQNNSDYLTCPVARLQQDSQGSWALDETFLPPLLALQGSRWLVTQLEQLMTSPCVWMISPKPLTVSPWCWSVAICRWHVCSGYRCSLSRRVAGSALRIIRIWGR